MKKLLFVFLMTCTLTAVYAQDKTEEELKEEMAPKKAEIAKLQKEVKSLQSQIDNLPGWKFGAFGTVGANFSWFNSWYSQGNPNVSSATVGATVNAFANKKADNYFWRNALNLNLGWVKFDDRDDPTDDDSFRNATDVFNITSLYGYKLSEKLAVSTLGEYRTTILDNFNDPGYLDVGVGMTWTPINNLTVVVHPLNYNFVFSSEDSVFESSLGAKIVADYTRQIGKIAFKSNLSAFQSYKSSDYSNFTWINSFNYKLFNNIGVGFEFGLRGNKQENLDYQLAEFVDNGSVGTEPNFDNLDSQLQSYYLLGLTYSF
ncbi:DUF3078 domain-containing protein [Leeuwenhoekiella polynyae]|uniref:DUF3078 family protein n=1 Tax=Leeuwenhoekiella polynyae TaxID=1550906 RepID=A0A4Q0P5L4_9FLAO|nr:DUF3078 domain-containing protein [Leeuwenhoekiella polynyae]RXG20919.1 hypothetical protein DSM02_2290 [Leeuwenhoekiella polynyae]|eukprot:TRINITY_DN47506_c0_g1_i1.p1 TRINITY_DN47506_c0_g1~~TRINITY_DN47506_c0_g1_i1.p1  ORF type:complete len:316 (-),score=-4.90 TRINITY_DN47506_c0_g1_i1:22-969(-)